MARPAAPVQGPTAHGAHWTKRSPKKARNRFNLQRRESGPVRRQTGLAEPAEPQSVRHRHGTSISAGGREGQRQLPRLPSSRDARLAWDLLALTDRSQQK